MKRYFIWLIAALTVATYSAAESPQWNRVLAIQPKITATPSATTKARVLLAYTSAQGAVYRIAETDSVLELGGVNTTAADGERRLNVRNTVSRTYTPVEGDLDTDASGKLWIYTGGQWVENGAASPAPVSLSSIADWPATVSATEVNHLDGVTSAIQTQLNDLEAAILVGNSGYVAVPVYSDDPCSVGQWSVDSNYKYVCKATDTWDRVALTAWSNPEPITPTPETCTTTFAQSTYKTSNVGVASAATNYYRGLLVTGATKTICSVSFWVTNIAANDATFDTYSYTIKVFGRSGNNLDLGNVKATGSTLNGTQFTADQQITFTFSPAVSVAAGDVITIVPNQAAASGRYMTLGYDPVDHDGGYAQLATYDNTGVLQSTSSIYELYYAATE